MKKKYTVILSLLVLAFCSCEECKDCRPVVFYMNGTVAVDNTTPEEYCGQDLEAIENEDTVFMGTDRYSIYVCE